MENRDNNLKLSILFNTTQVRAYDVRLRDGKNYLIPEYAGKILIGELNMFPNKFYRLDNDYYRGSEIVKLIHTYMSFDDLSDVGKREVLKRNPDLFKDDKFPELTAELDRISKNTDKDFIEETQTVLEFN